MITVLVNGDAQEIPDGLTLAALLDRLKLPADRVAVERNLEIVPRDQWSRTPIQGGDRLEVVHFVGGGTKLEPPMTQTVQRGKNLKVTES